MILVGNQRGGCKDLADHLLKAENEKIIIHQIRGFMGDDLHSALQESYAISRATNAKQHLYSLSFNPPKYADVSDEEFEAAIDRAEKLLGLDGQPRAMVFHHKKDRDGNVRIHAHAVWCRIDIDNMRAIHMPFDYTRLENLSRELFLENGWELPKGFENKKDRNPLNYKHAEHQQARRRDKYADDIKRIFQNAWAASDTKDAFAAALEEQGYVLARGDKGRYVAVDGFGEVYAIPRALDVYTKDVRAKLGEADELLLVEEAHAKALELAPDTREAEQTNQSAFAKQLQQKPELLFERITAQESTFTRHDIARQLGAHIDDPDIYRDVFDRLMSSNDLVALNKETVAEKQVRYSTKHMLELERKLIKDAHSMSKCSDFKTPQRHVQRAIDD